MQRGIEYMSVYKPFAARQPRVIIPEIPPQTDVPLPRWLMSDYLRDVMSRIDDVKAKLTSTFGSVLEVVSTKKLSKKLASAAARTAQWMTDVRNDHSDKDAVLCFGTGRLTWTHRKFSMSAIADPQLVRSSTDGMTFRCTWTSGTAFCQRMHRGEPPAVRSVTSVDVHIRV